MPSGNLSEVGGLQGLKQWIAQRKKCFTPEAKAFGIEAPKGMLLAGPPGCGKSVCAKAVSGELGLPLIMMNISSVFNSLVGESEARIRSALKTIKAMSPCVVFLDEIDKAGLSSESQGDSGVGKRVLGNILTFMQEEADGVFFIFTANRPWSLSSELFRKGRLDEIFSVTLPNASEREDIFKIHLAKRGKNPDDVEGLSKAVKASGDFVPAELEGAVKEAIIKAFEKDLPVSGDLIVDALTETKKLKDAYPEDFSQMETWATNHARPSSLDEPLRNVTKPKRSRKIQSVG